MEEPLTYKICIDIPKPAARILSVLNQAGYEAYVVGGCVRDSLLGRKPQDWDITTSAAPGRVKSLFGRTIDTGIDHGTVTVMMHGRGYEVTTYRIDGEYEDGRHPKKVSFTGDLSEDLRRRDFTVNAMAYHPDTGVVDMFGGLEDMRSRLIRCVGDAGERFGEDALRMLRAVRFSAELGFDIEEKTKKAIARQAGDLSRISAERIRSELVRITDSPSPGYMRTACDLGITAVVMPEYDAMRAAGAEDHTLRAMENAEADTVLRWSMMMHDFGKAVTGKVSDDGTVTYPGHADAGADIADKVMRRLKFDNDTRLRTVRLIRWHSYRYDADFKDVRRALNRIGPDIFEDSLKVFRADAMAGDPEFTAERLGRISETEDIYHEIIGQGQCFDAAGLRISGRDLIDAGIRQGPDIGRILRELTEAVIDDQSLNDRETLLKLALDMDKN